MGVSGRLAAAQQVRAPLPERGQVPGQGAPGGLDVGGGLFQRQRQPAQLGGQVQGRPPVRVAGPADQELRGHLGSSTGTSRTWPGGQIWFRLVIRTRPGPAGGTNGATEAVRRVVEHQQPRLRAGGQHRVHGGHRVPAIGGVELGGQLTEPGRQDRRVLGG